MNKCLTGAQPGIMSAVPVLGKTAVIAFLCTFVIGTQDPPPADKPVPVAPTIRLPLASLRPESAIDIAGDRLMASGDAGIWVSAREAGTVTKIDGKTNKPAEPIAVGKEPCAGLATGFGSLIAPLCGASGLARVDVKTNDVKVVVKTVMPATIGPVTAVSSIWVVS